MSSMAESKKREMMDVGYACVAEEGRKRVVKEGSIMAMLRRGGAWAPEEREVPQLLAAEPVLYALASASTETRYARMKEYILTLIGE